MASGTSSPIGGAQLGGSVAPTVSLIPGGQVSSNLSFYWDFDNDGDFDQAEEDVTSLVLAAQAAYGRDYPSNLTGHSAPGELKLTLNNDDDRFSYFNADSPLNQDPFSLKTGRRFAIRANDADNGAASISYVGIGAAASASNASVVPALPTGLVEGDLMVIAASIRNSGTGTVNTPSGWANMVTTGNLTVLAKYYETGDTAPTVSFANGVANASTYARCFAFRGVHPQLTRAFVQSASQSNASATNIAIPGCVATTHAWLADPDDVTSVVIGWRQDDATSIAQLSGQFFTEIADDPVTAGDDVHMEVQYRLGEFTNAKTVSATNLTVTTAGGAAVSRAIVFQLAPHNGRTEPVLLARDTFTRADAALGMDELGGTWTVRSGGGHTVAGGRATPRTGVAAQYATEIISTVDTSTTDHYVQAVLTHPVQDGRIGVVGRWADANNYVRCYLEVRFGAVYLDEVKAGVATELGAFFVESWEGMTLGLRIRNQQAAILIGGTPLFFGSVDGDEHTLTNTITGTHAGLYGRWQTHSDLAPVLDDFAVWDRTADAMDGAIWTGTIKSVRTNVKAGDLKVVEVVGQGPLAGAAGIDVAAPRIVRHVGESATDTSSVPAGCIVGDIMARAGLQTPPFPTTCLPTSDIGPVSMKDGKALDLARAVELTERGFLKETPEGSVTFEDRAHRDDLSSQAWFTDTPGRGQFVYEEIEPLDHEGQIVNRAVAQVAPTAPTVVNVDNQGDDDASLDVVITVPELAPRDLLLVFIACSAQQDDRGWYEPAGWTRHRDVADQLGMRIFSLIADGTESGTQVTFLKTETQGTFLAHTYVIRDWYGTDDGIKVGRVSSGAVGGTNAYPVSPGWNRAPALYIVFQCAIGASTGILWDDLNTPPPVGYNYNSLEGLVFVTTPASLETGVESIYKHDVTDTEDPRAWENVFTDYLLLETVCVAIRGFNGPLEKPTIDDQKATVQDGLIVSRDDYDSQLDHRFIRTNPDLPILSYTEADAVDWCNDVLTEFSQDRPIFSLAFTAVKHSGLRAQARNRRVGDKVTVTATGRSGLGVEGDFFIEHIHHEWSHGTKYWKTYWELSPA